MKKRRGDFSSLAGDGWVRLGPGDFYECHRERPVAPTVAELHHRMMQMRGRILSTSFGIENELILLALADEFGSNDHGMAGSDYFQREHAWREDHRLERKIERVKPIIRQRRSKEIADLIIQRLMDIGSLGT